MKSKTQLVVTFIVGLLVGVGGGFFVASSFFNTGGELTDDLGSRLRAGSTESVDDSTNRYENKQYRFSLEYPKELIVQEFDEGEGASTIVFQEPDTERGFQMFILPYSADTITEERIKKDVPGAVVKNPTDIILPGNIQAVHFESESPIIGPSSEVWFINNGYLFEVTTYAQWDTELAKVLNTLQF